MRVRVADRVPRDCFFGRERVELAREVGPHRGERGAGAVELLVAREPGVGCAAAADARPPFGHVLVRPRRFRRFGRFGFGRFRRIRRLGFGRFVALGFAFVFVFRGFVVLEVVREVEHEERRVGGHFFLFVLLTFFFFVVHRCTFFFEPGAFYSVYIATGRGLALLASRPNAPLGCKSVKSFFVSKSSEIALLI